MPSLIWTRGALADVARLHAFPRAKDPDAAKRAVDAIRRTAAALIDRPRIGRPAPDIGPGYRELVVPFGRTGYVVLYRIDDETVAILAVRHRREAGYPDRG